MKTKFRKYTKEEQADIDFRPCDKCAKDGEEVDGNCVLKNNCIGGYYVRYRPRKSRDRRLLEALLKCLDLSADGVFSGKLVNISAGNQLRLLAVKKAIQKGAK